jgi:drug/metabolite transporter (DMT)-like permease
MLVALLCFSCLDASAKWLSRSVDPLLTVWARYAMSVLLVSIVLNPISRPALIYSHRPWLQWGRSLMLFLSTGLNFLALQYLQLVETISITFATPLLVALFAGPILGERVGLRRGVIIAFGFLGVVIATGSGFSTMHPAALLSLGGAVCYSFNNILTRLLAAHDPPQVTMVYTGLAGVVVMTPFLPWIWSTPPSLLTWALMAATGVLASLGHWLLILAHARAPASTLAPFMYTQLLWMLGLGYIIFGDWPDIWTLVGASVVIASGLYLLYYEGDLTSA